MFSASKTDLKNALALSGDIVSSRNTIPILSNLLIDRAADGGALIRMTDLDVEAEIRLDAQIEDGFRPFTVHAGMLRSIIGKLPDDQVSITPETADFNQVRIKSGRSSFGLLVLPAIDFPQMSKPGFTGSFTATAGALAEAVAAVSFAISTEETRYYLNGIHLHGEDGGIIMVATDSHRLARHFVEAQREAEIPDVIVPRKTCGILGKLLAKSQAPVMVDVSQEKIRFTLDRITITSRLIDGTFPDYRRVIPQEAANRASLDSGSLREAVDRVMTVSSERGNAAKFRFAGGTLILEARNPEAGEAQETLGYEGNADMEIGFNARYVLQAIGSRPDGPLTLEMQDHTGPAIMRHAGDRPENLVVLMPMRV